MSVFFARRKTFLTYTYEHPIDRPKYRPAPNTIWKVGLTKLCILQSLVENPNNLILRSNLWPVWPKLDEFLKKKGRGVALTNFTPQENSEFQQAIRSGRGKITIEIRFGGRRLIPPTTTEMPFQPIPTTSFARKLLEEQIQTDVHLVALNGDMFPCHKGFLAANSTWFHHLFQSRPEEKIWKFRMTKEGLAAFLKYIYYADTDDPKNNLKIGMELLKIGRTYKIASMEKGMMDLLLEVPTTAFSWEIASELFYFTRKEEGFETLRNKALELMKLNYVEVSESETLQGILGGEDLDTKKELDLIGFHK
ncbi:unnamed protein product [Orchesella dallaii]|uniref:BTB domain-containing protein n=1 Tax=Orchesella dallaii TaxID=48710 RepID=A0ABP1RYT2_9HEXA